MSIEREEGYEYRGWKLGEKVMYGGKECIIIGFDEKDVDIENIKNIILSGKLLENGILRVRESIHATTVLYGWEDVTYWKWVKPSEIQKNKRT